MLNFNDFGRNFMLVGFSISRNNDKEKVYLHFLYQLDNGKGYGTFRTSSEKERLFKMCPEKDFYLGGIYDVRTDKFLNDDKQLVTFLKSVSLIRKDA